MNMGGDIKMSDMTKSQKKFALLTCLIYVIIFTLSYNSLSPFLFALGIIISIMLYRFIEYKFTGKLVHIFFGYHEGEIVVKIVAYLYLFICLLFLLFPIIMYLK